MGKHESFRVEVIATSVVIILRHIAVHTSYCNFVCSSAGMAPPKYEMAVGLNKGHKVTPHNPRPKPSRRKGVGALYTYMSYGCPLFSGFE